MEKHTSGLSEQEKKLFDDIVKDLNAAIKNSVLYTPDHPICSASIQNLRSSLEKWIVAFGAIRIGIAQDKLYCNDRPVEEDRERYKDAAEFLHVRGIVALSFSPGISQQELFLFFSSLRKDANKINEAGGIKTDLPGTPHLEIKEIDYSQLLGSAREEVDSEEEEIWQSLFKIAEELEAGVMPDSSMEFIGDFLKDSDRSARTLNRIYHDAVDKMQGGEKAAQIRDTIARICAHFEKGEFSKAQEVKVDIMKILSNLDADLVTQLFEKTEVEGREFDMAENVTQGFSDSFIADFIESLISKKESFNENMLKVFDRLAPDDKKADSIVSMVADKLIRKRVLNPETLSKLQMSIKDIFSSNPQSSFMTQMHKITVDAVANKKIDTLIHVARLSPLINKFVQSVEQNKLKKEEVWLLLNILWLEEDAGDFKKYGMKLLDVFPELVDMKEVRRIGEIIEFFSEDVRSEQLGDENMRGSIEEVLGELLKKENIQAIISMIPGANSSELQEISEILGRAQAGAAGNVASLLIDAYIEEKNPAYRNKYRTVLARIKKEVVEEVMDRMDYSEPAVVRELFQILKEYDPEKAHLVANRLLANKNPQVRWEGLDGFVPEGKDERDNVFNMFVKENIPEIQKKAAEVLIKSGDEKTLEKLFAVSWKDLFSHKKLLMVVEICGKLRVKEAFPFLKKLFSRKALFFRNRNDELRMAVATSLGRLQTEEAMEVIKSGAADSREKVRNMCDILIKLGGDTGTRTEKEDGRKNFA
jgi:HEAT repeat protein